MFPLYGHCSDAMISYDHSLRAGELYFVLESQPHTAGCDYGGIQKAPLAVTIPYKPISWKTLRPDRESQL